MSDNCYLLLSHEQLIVKKENMKESELIKLLESKEEEDKIVSLQKIINMIISGENCNKLLIPVIKFCLRSENHMIKKLLLIYWEVVERYVPNTKKLLPEFILVCNNLRNDLNHPNEYIRGCTLRFLTKVSDIEILESLVPAINANLEHRHSYVRKNAVLTVYTIYQAHPELIPDAADLIEKFLLQESNLSAKRNAFLMLYQCDQERATLYLNSIIEQIGTMGENFQLVVFELIRKVCRSQPSIKSLYFKAIYSLVNSTSHAVAYEAANTLIALSSAPTAVRASIAAYTTLLLDESDNNIKLIILSKLVSLKERHEKLLQENSMDLLRILSSPNIDIRKKTLDLILDLLSVRNVDEVIQFLKKELLRLENIISVSNETSDKIYRKFLINAIYQCAVKFPEFASIVVSILMMYVGIADAFIVTPFVSTTSKDEKKSSTDPNATTQSKSSTGKSGSPVITNASYDVIMFLREIVENYPQLRQDILKQLIDCFTEIKSAPVFRVALWILGEYVDQLPLLQSCFQVITHSIGELPLIPANPDNKDEKEKEDEKPAIVSQKSKVIVLADGTYATQAAAEIIQVAKAAGPLTSLRKIVTEGDNFLCAIIAVTLTKLTLKYAEMIVAVKASAVVLANRQYAQSIQLVLALLALGNHPLAVKKMEIDNRERLALCIQTLINPAPFKQIFLTKCRETYKNFLDARKHLKVAKKKTIVDPLRQVDDLIVIRQLKPTNHYAGADEDDDIKAIAPKSTEVDLITRLKTCIQLTGLGDAIYAEAFCDVHDFDVMLEITLLNQTNETLQNLQIELASSGDLKIVERAQTYTLGPLESKKITTCIKVTSTENGTIFGNIVYDTPGHSERKVIVMNTIHMDIMDYISPADSTELLFRAMWAEFEWENKVGVNTDILDVKEYLDYICKITNMKVLTQPAYFDGKCNVLSANLYAISIFGEDALLNLSIERSENGEGPLVGFIRIRSKTQGIALSLGDKVQSKQKRQKQLN